MVDRPIIFSAPMVLALLEGRKTMTRRLAWRPCERACDLGFAHPHDHRTRWQRVEPGDRLWVREAAMHNGGSVCYRVDDERIARGVKWLPSIHMPRAWSRLTLTVTATKVERLQEISEADAGSEGVAPEFGHGPEVHRIAFMHLWDALHGRDSWNNNPEVVALTFTVAKANVDKDV